MIAPDGKISKQVNQCIDLLRSVLGHHLLGAYLYGSAIVGGLQKYSDIDIFVISERATTPEEKNELIKRLLQISGIYMKSAELPIELTIVVKSEVNPWHYPATFDFQYGEWLRSEFENCVIEPWHSKEMPDLAILITQVLLANSTLFGPDVDQLLSRVPYPDFILATTASLQHLNAELLTDTRNVLLTCARIWRTLETDTICSKPIAAVWAIKRSPNEYRCVLERAQSICLGQSNEYWDDVRHLIQPCADFMLQQINKKIIQIENADDVNKVIQIDHSISDY